MKKYLLLAAIAALIPTAALAMSATPTVPVGTTPVPISELNAVVAVQTCVRRVYDSRNVAQRLLEGRQVDYVSVQASVARQAQRVNNATAFSEARKNVADTVLALGYAC